MTRSAPLPSPATSSSRTTATGIPVELAHHELGRAGDLVRDGDDGGVELVADAVPLPAEVDERVNPAQPTATSVVPCRQARPNESLTITATSRPVSSRSRSRIVAAEASGSTGSSTSVSGPGAFDASTPAEAQTKPCLWSARSRAAGAGGRSERSRGESPRSARVAVGRERLARARTARRPRAARFGPPPSRRPSGRRRRRRRPRASTPRRSAALRSAPGSTSGRLLTARTFIRAR